MVHGHPVVDADKHFIIDPITRAVTNAESKKNMLMQNDHNSEQFTFEIDKIVEGHDMTLCNKIEVHYINTDSATKEKSPGVYEVRDFQISESDETKAVFTWLVSQNATLYAGTLQFLVLFACEEDGVTTYRWNTGVNNSISIAKGMNNGEAIETMFPDILAIWKEDLYNRNYAYEGAVANGFEGTEEEWYQVLLEAAREDAIWDYKQNKLGWVTEADIDAMFEGTYVGTEDETNLEELELVLLGLQL